MPAALTLTPSADNTLYQDAAGQLSNGAGHHFYVGDTNQSSNAIRRGAVKFDLSAVPAGSIILSATLTLHMSMTRSGAESIDLHRALQNWGEGTSNAGLGTRGEGIGTQATTNDVTWIYTFFNTQRWNTPGGDFVPTASASTSVADVGSYQWTGAGVVADVQQWVNNPGTDFGWIITGNETTRQTAKQFDTKENATAANRPVLTIVYSVPVPDLTIAKSHVGIFHAGDAADTYSITVRNVGAAPTNGTTVTVTDQLPTGLSPTAADLGTQNGWSVSFNGQTVTATRSDVLPQGASYPTLTVTVSVADNITRTFTNIATVAGGGEVNTANDTATDPTASTVVADLTISKSHAGSFHQRDAADRFIVVVRNAGVGATVGPVTVTDTLPAGLLPTAADNRLINGWLVTFSGQTITATRSDVLAAGASYPVLTLTVSVAAAAPASVTNIVKVSGGGELNTSNDTAFDVAAITPLVDIRRRRGA
jgi:uncharacterized repeat protein (TIGR01451 family)